MRLARTVIRLIIAILFVPSVVFAQPSLTTLAGKQIPWSTLQGKWVIINYWASWCHPCVEEIKELNAFYYRNHAQVALYAFNYEGVSTQDQKQLIKDFHIHYPSLREDPAEQLHVGDIMGVPVTFIWDPHGNPVKTLYGPQTVESLEAIVVAKK